MRTIRLYGRLAKFLGQRKFVAKVSNAAEAVRFLVVNFPQLEEHMADQYYKVKVGKREVSTDELHEPSSEMEDIQVIPVIAGAGGEAGQIALGVLIIAASFFFPAAAGATAALKIGASTFSAFGAGLFSVGAFLVLSGVASLLTPTQTLSTGADSQDDPRKSYSFSGIQNVSRQGVPVPIVYGETLVGSVVISAGIDIDQVKA